MPGEQKWFTKDVGHIELVMGIYNNHSTSLVYCSFFVLNRTYIQEPFFTRFPTQQNTTFKGLTYCIVRQVMIVQLLQTFVVYK